MCFLHAYSVVDFRDATGRRHPMSSLVPKSSSKGRNLPLTIPFSRALPNRRPMGGVGGKCLVPATVAGIKITYYTSVMQQERSYFRLLLFCIGFQGCWCVSLHAYKSPSLLSKPVSPVLRATTDWDVVVKKKPSKTWELLFVWRSGRDSNSRPHAWQACILTKLNYRTVHYCIWFFKGLSLSLKCGCKSTTFFWIHQIKMHIFWN